MERVRRLSWLLVVVVLCYPWVGWAESMSFREQLVANESVRLVLPLGDHYTLVGAGGAVWNTYPELVRIGQSLGGVPEVLITETDPFTRQSQERWVEVALRQKGRDYVYSHPLTGKEEPFGYGEMYSHREFLEGINFPPAVRMGGVYELIERFMDDPVRKTSTTVGKVVGTLLFYHPTREPFVYKDRSFMAAEKLLEPPPRLEDVTNWAFVRPEERDSKLMSALTITGKIMGLNVVSPTEGVDATASYKPYYLGYGALCARQGHTPSFLVRASGALSRPSPTRILDFITTKAGTRNTDFFLSCPGEEPFSVVIATDNRGAFKVHRRTDATMEQITGYSDPQQPQYPWMSAETAPLERKPPTAVAAGDSFELEDLHQALQVLQTQSMGLQQRPMVAQSAPITPSSQEDDLALQAASLKATVRKEAGSLYAGLYHGIYQGCDHVSTIQNWRDFTPSTNRTPPQEQLIWNYRICNGQIAEKVRTTFPGTRGLPDQLGDFAQQVARDARNYGVAEASTGGFTIRGFALREQGGCQVDVRYFKAMEFLAQELRNGCR